MNAFNRLNLLGVLFVAIVSTAALTGCGSDACEEATEKLESECGAELDEPKDSTECTGNAECVAECVVDACTCEDYEGTIAEASDTCQSCLLECEAS